MEFLSQHPLNHTLLLVLALVIAFAFECVNGFHDTANAVATVIYTRSLRPWSAVIWSGICNFIGVYAGGIGVAYSMVHLLPVDLLVNVETRAGLAMVLSLLSAAILWNFGTWFLGLPSSSSHALIGAILGTGLVNSWMTQYQAGSGVNWKKAEEVGLALLLSPLLGFILAAALLVVMKRFVRAPELYDTPHETNPPPFWIRAILISTCTGVSFAHGSNDGQKGMGLIMLILIGLVPAHFALDMNYDSEKIDKTLQSARKMDEFLAKQGLPAEKPETPPEHVQDAKPRALLAEIIATLQGKESFTQLTSRERWNVRTAIVELQVLLVRVEERFQAQMDADRKKILKSLKRDLAGPVEYVPSWVVLGVALALGVGTMVGWKRIVVTVGEKIGKTHLSYAQGACAELVAMSTIGFADFLGMPVSTTHVLSSGVAGTMWANRSGIQGKTVLNIALAWVLTLPASMALSMALFWVAHQLLV